MKGYEQDLMLQSRRGIARFTNIFDVKKPYFLKQRVLFSSSGRPSREGSCAPNSWDMGLRNSKDHFFSTNSCWFVEYLCLSRYIWGGGGGGEGRSSHFELVFSKTKIIALFGYFPFPKEGTAGGQIVKQTNKHWPCTHFGASKCQPHPRNPLLSSPS